MLKRALAAIIASLCWMSGMGTIFSMLLMTTGDQDASIIGVIGTCVCAPIYFSLNQLRADHTAEMSTKRTAS